MTEFIIPNATLKTKFIPPPGNDGRAADRTYLTFTAPSGELSISTTLAAAQPLRLDATGTLILTGVSTSVRSTLGTDGKRVKGMTITLITPNTTHASATLCAACPMSSCSKSSIA